MTTSDSSTPMIESPLVDDHEVQSHLKPPTQDNLDRPGAATGIPESRLELEYLPWGGGDHEGHETDSARPDCLILATCGWVELEYAIMRRGVGMLDMPHRGTVEVWGDDRKDLINRLVTQDLKSLGDTRACRAFLTNRTGRIQADLIIVSQGDRILLDVDLHQAAMVADLLSENIFIEDVRVEHATDRWYRIGLHGPQVPAVLASWGGCPDSPLQVSPLDIDGVEVLAIRQDLAATTGCELLLPRPAALDVWTAIRQRAQIVGVGTRTVGWYAFNTARLEGGTPLFNIDFGPTNLPHETGLFQDCVSLTKGCYPGQEIVARMENLGSPKQQVRGLRMTNESLPVAGAQVYAADDDALAQPVGVVTSSAASPLLSGHPVVLAMVRKRVVAEGTAVRVHVEGQPCEATVQGLDPLQQPRTPPETSS